MSVVELAVHRRDHAADLGVARVEVLLHAADEVARQRLDGQAAALATQVDRRPLFGGDALQQAEREAGRGLATQLEGAQNAREAGHIDVRLVGNVRIVAGGAPDAARIEQRVPNEVAAGDRRSETQVQDLLALDEERTLLREEGLEGAQVDLGGIGLHLSEVRIDGVGDSDLAVEAELELLAATVAEGIAGLLLVPLCAGDTIGQQLEPPFRLQVVEAAELAESADPAIHVLWDPLPGRALLEPEEASMDLQPPGLFRRAAEAELAQGDPHLRRPALAIDPRGSVPDGIPVGVPGLTVVGDQLVAAGSGEAEGEGEGRAAVLVAVDVDLDPVPGEVIPPGQDGTHELRVVLETKREVEGPVVVDDLEPALLGGWLAIRGVPLDEVARPVDGVPDRVVQDPVDDRGLARDPTGVVDAPLDRLFAGSDRGPRASYRQRASTCCVNPPTSFPPGRYSNGASKVAGRPTRPSRTRRPSISKRFLTRGVAVLAFPQQFFHWAAAERPGSDRDRVGDLCSPRAVSPTVAGTRRQPS